MDVPPVYTEFSNLGRLRVQARQNDQDALPAVATQFEALFLQMMLKSLRDATLGDPLLGGDSVRFYQDLFDHQVALDLARPGGIGLADLLVRQLGGSEERSGAMHPATALPMLEWPQAPASAPAAQAVTLAGERLKPLFDSPARFVLGLRPYAQRAAEQLGVLPEVLIAQAALETGWGQAMIRYPDGKNSFNFFGIKASPHWRGPRVVVPTLEFSNGVMERSRAAFRAYASIAESFADYVALLRDQSRYGSALATASDPVAFLRNLQQAGYATDPSYADKVLALMATAPLQTLKLSSAEPLEQPR